MIPRVPAEINGSEIRPVVQMPPNHRLTDSDRCQACGQSMPLDISFRGTMSESERFNIERRTPLIGGLGKVRVRGSEDGRTFRHTGTLSYSEGDRAPPRAARNTAWARGIRLNALKMI